MNIKEDFPLLEKDIIYLDSGATTQRPKQVIDAVSNYYDNSNANPHRGAYDLSIEATNLYEDTRKKVKNFINANSEKEIIFSKNATEALNTIAYSYGLDNVEKDDEIVISIMEHHSNLVPWQMVAKKKNAKLNYMYIDENFEIPDTELDKINAKTKIVSITHISNVLGTINNIEKIIQKAHSVGAIVIVDASQSIAHKKIDVQKLDVDFLVFSGHKMLSPMGVGILYGKEKLLENMSPFLLGGDMIEYVWEQDTQFAPLPNKFEAGTQNVEGVIGLSAAIDYLTNIGYDNIEKIDRELEFYAREQLQKLDFLELYLPKQENHSPVFSFNIKGVHPHDVATVLNSKNVCVRSGNHCAQPLLRFLNQDSTIRASFYIYNTKEDVDKLVEALKETYKMFEKYIQRENK